MTRSARAALALLVAAASCTASQPARRAGAGDLGALAAARLDGTPVALRGPGSPRLVELWATWCEPCAHAAAAARPVLARHPRVHVYAVSVDDDRAAVASHPFALGEVLVAAGGAAGAARAGFDRLPTFIALDAHGRVVGTVTGAAPNLAAALDRMLRHAEGGVGERE
ncbi:MAG: TlpA family protein disulfide reductase [Anaeromyxobacteraceae bacterium]